MTAEVSNLSVFWMWSHWAKLKEEQTYQVYIGCLVVCEHEHNGDKQHIAVY